MNIKGIIFLLLTVIVLSLTINTVKNRNHFFVRYRSNVNFEESLMMNDVLYVKSDTDIYIESFKQEKDMDIVVKISNPEGVYYLNESGEEEEPYKLHLEKGLYDLTVEGMNGMGKNFDLRICYFTDELEFMEEEE